MFCLSSYIVLQVKTPGDREVGVDLCAKNKGEMKTCMDFIVNISN